jgi:hypothetical protein
MYDSSGDGWNGNKLAITQNNEIVNTFGAGFGAGSFSGPTYITVQGGALANIIVNTIGNKSQEVGFLIRVPNSTIIYQRASGTAFSSGTVFLTFCPNGNCVGSL